jgi:predicted N-acetyltransferase YhbS
MNIEIRGEERRDFRLVEELTREAFWNVYVPGCNEHLLAHNLRGAKEFISELDLVAFCEGKIIGNIMYTRSKIIANANTNPAEIPVLTFGPLSVLPEYQNKGVGKALVEHSVRLAKKMGERAFFIYGDPEYYRRFGFKVSKEYGVSNDGGNFPAALLTLELYAGALEGINGMFEEAPVFEVIERELEEFERGFPKKEKGYSKSQERFRELSSSFLI